MNSVLQTRRRSASACGGGCWSASVLLSIHLHRLRSGVLRRGAAILLLALFSLSPVTPALLASDADSKLPACCRRGGAHHCIMMVVLPSSGPVVRAAPCPYFPGTKVLSAPSRTGLPKASEAAFAIAVRQPAPPVQAGIAHRLSPARAHHKRGPPSFPLHG
jgi:hypothetical protein